MADLITRANLKVFLEITGTDEDSFLDLIIPLVSEGIERYCNTFFSDTTITDELIDGGKKFLRLQYWPIISVTTLTDAYDESTVASTEYAIDKERGLLYFEPSTLSTLQVLNHWLPGMKRYKVTYHAGRSSVPASVKLAAYQWCAAIRAKRASNIKSESVGDYSVTYQDAINGMPDEVAEVLDLYKNYAL